MDPAPAGYVHLASFELTATVSQAKDILSGAGIDVIVEDHRGTVRWRSIGAVLLFVPRAQATRAAELIRHLGATHGHAARLTTR